MRDIVGTERLAKDLGVSGRTIRNWINGGEMPHAGATQNRQRTERFVVEWARGQLQAEGSSLRRDPSATLWAHLNR